MNLRVLAFASSLLAATAAAAPADDETTELPPVDVTGKPSPLSSDRARYEEMAPCIGCDGEATESDSFLTQVLKFTILPSEPPDNRDLIPISDRVKPLDRFKDKQP